MKLPNLKKITSSHLPKLIFWTISILLVVLLAQNITTHPEQTLQNATLLILLILIYKRLQIGLYIIIFLPVVGELLRYPPGSEGGVLLSDIFIPLFLITWLTRIFIETGTIKSFTKKLPTITLPLTIFIIVGSLSLLQALLYLTPKEVASSSLYLIRFLQYTLLFFATYQILTPTLNSKTPTPRSKPATLKVHSTFKVPSINQKPFNSKVTPPTPKTLITLLTISTSLIAIAGFIQLQIFPDLASLEEEGWDPHINRLVSTWLDPNFVGGLLAFMISILLGITLHLKKISQKIGLLTIIAILAAALFLTYSRSAYVAATVGLTVVSLLKSRKILIIALILFLIGITVSDRARERTQELTTSATSIIFNTAENPDPTARLRIKSWEQTFELFTKRPLLGSGYNTLRYVNHQEGYVKDPDIHSASGSDSSLLTILATTGILGFIPFLTLYLILIWSSFKNWRNKKLPDYLKGYNLGFMAGIFALLIHSVFVNSLLFPQIMIFFWIAAALTFINTEESTST